MKQLFPAWANSVFRTALGGVVTGAVGLVLLLMIWVRAPPSTGQNEPIVQPVKFDHRHHVRDDGINCLYCHSGATRSAYAGIPSASLCMNCHNQIWPSSPELAPVREAYFGGAPLVWQRVNNLPRHVFFNHSIHLAKGVGCVSCHGRIDQMGMVYQDKTLLMQWCLDCHRHPESQLRPLDKVTDMGWEPQSNRENLGRALSAELNVHPTTDCSGCHR